MNGIQVHIDGWPLVIQCFENGLITIYRSAEFKTILDQPNSTEDLVAIFDNDGFTIGTESYDYGAFIDYKNTPDVLKWLKQQGLKNPFN